jgi:Holliday junction resolvase
LNNQQRKGSKYENELAKYFREQAGVPAFRSPLSGGGFGHDPMADILGTPGLHIEAKRTERPQILPALEQAEAALSRSYSGDAPIVITRKNNVPTGQSLCVMRLEDFIKLYKVFLLHTGYIKE